MKRAVVRTDKPLIRFRPGPVAQAWTAIDGVYQIAYERNITMDHPKERIAAAEALCWAWKTHRDAARRQWWMSQMPSA